jgi:TIR domain
MRPSQVFISYRRDDAAGYARAIADGLSRRLGAERVFIDVDDIGAGQGFAGVIERAVADSGILLVLIGRRWPGARDGAPPRLHDADDFVRLEVAAGLQRGVRLIPLLLDGATMPAAAELPEDLRPLAGRQALELGNARFADDMARLEAALDLPEATQPGRRGRRGLAAALVVAGFGAAVAAFWLLRPPARAAVDGDWAATVTYDWPNARYEEHFRFASEGQLLHGSASFLGVARGVLEGRVEGDGLSFVTHSREGDGVDTVHRYRGRLSAGELHFVMQTEGGSSPHVPVEFSARRAGPAER